MTKLYVNGCSFTHGHNFDDAESYNQLYGDFVYQHMMHHEITWPWQLAPEFSFVFNHARQGTGAMRMVRTTLDFLKHIDDTDIADWVFVLQFSQPNRFECVSGEHYDFYPQVNLIRQGVNQGVLDRYSVEIPLNETIKTERDIDCVLIDNPDLNQEFTDLDQDKLTKLILSEYVNYARSIKHQLYVQTKELHLIVTELERRGANYLITSMDNLGMPHSAGAESQCGATQNLQQLIPAHNIINNMEDIIASTHTHAETHDPCGHPNETGHKLVARYILDEMKKRGYV